MGLSEALILRSFPRNVKYWQPVPTACRRRWVLCSFCETRDLQRQSSVSDSICNVIQKLNQESPRYLRHTTSSSNFISSFPSDKSGSGSADFRCLCDEVSPVACKFCRWDMVLFCFLGMAEIIVDEACMMYQCNL